jgi:NAD(P)-dependent dehydrogenase (short-subunit alcohol dehydrogenase family)
VSSTSSSDRFAGRTAIVTGGGSGIGAALTRALVERGASVVCSDIDVEAATDVARSATGPGSARAARLDVTDAGAVQALVDDVVTESGQLDLMFNNAGIVFGGETEDLTLQHWNAIIDVNLRGVVHGVAAAYPLMVKQGSGHIVNTASMGGLMAAGLITSYVTTKHAVVGLSLALRSEARAKGVGVSVICPAAVETPILDKGAVGAFNGRDYYLTGQGVRRAHPPEVLAQEVLRTIERNKAMLVTPRQARMAWRVGRLAPGFVQKASASFVEARRKQFAEHLKSTH